MSDAEGRDLTLWAFLIGMLLVAAIFGVLGLALGMALKDSGFLGGGAKESVVVQMLGERGGDSEADGSSSTPAAAAPPVVLDLDVNAVGAPPASSPGTVAVGGGNAGPPVSVNVAGAVATARAVPVAEAGDAADSAETVSNPCGAPCPFCRDRAGDSRVVPGPCRYAELLGRVEFQTGRRAILASHAERLEEIANALDARAGVLLVIGHTDSCGGSRLARRRAKRVRNALKDLLTRRSSWSGWERAAGNRVHAQAAGEDPRAPEGSCQSDYYRSAAVYLIEGLK